MGLWWEERWEKVKSGKGVRKGDGKWDQTKVFFGGGTDAPGLELKMIVAPVSVVELTDPVSDLPATCFKPMIYIQVHVRDQTMLHAAASHHLYV